MIHRGRKDDGLSETPLPVAQDRHTGMRGLADRQLPPLRRGPGRCGRSSRRSRSAAGRTGRAAAGQRLRTPRRTVAQEGGAR